MKLADVQELLDRGLVILPAKHKHPYIEGWQQVATPHDAADQWKGVTAPQAALVVAPSGLVVLDIDTEEAADLWRTTLPAAAKGAAPQSYTGPAPDLDSGRGLHLWFRRPVGMPAQDRSGQDWTLRAFGVIIVPPSAHGTMNAKGKWVESGVDYEWHKPLPDTFDAIPEFPLSACAHLLGKATSSLAPAPFARALTMQNGRPSLQALVDDPPQPGNRDSTVIATMGRFARQAWPDYEYATGEVTRVAELLHEPDFTADDYLERFERAWGYEHAKRNDVGLQYGVVLDPAECVTKLRIKTKDDVESDEVWLPWLITDARSYRNGTGESHYQLDIRRIRGGRLVDLTVPVPAKAFGTPTDLKRALAAHKCSMHVPGRPAAMPHLDGPTRMLEMLEGWWPQEWVKLAPGLWTKTELAERRIEVAEPYVFITADQVLGHTGEPIPTHTPDGEVSIPVMVDTPRISFPLQGDRVQALDAWQSLLTFHFTEVVAPLAALTALLPLKPLFIHSAFFPFVALTGQAGSGKSKGFLPLLVAASGMAEGTGRITAAGAKRMMGDARAGWLWLDDMEDPGKLAEILRQVTDEHTMRQAADSTTHRMNEFPLLQMPMISGETLGSLEGERALEERVVKVDVPGMVKGRKSLIHPSKAQWPDIEAWSSKWRGGLGIAGHLVAAALHACTVFDDPRFDLVDAARRLGSATDSSDRLAQKEGALQLGVRLATFMARGCPPDELERWYLADYRPALTDKGPHAEVNLIEWMEGSRESRLQHDEQGKVKRLASNVRRVIADYLADMNAYTQSWILPRDAGDGLTESEHMMLYPVKVNRTIHGDPVVYVHLAGLVSWAKKASRFDANNRVISKDNWSAELREYGWVYGKVQRTGARVWTSTPEQALLVLNEAEYEYPPEAGMPKLPPVPEGVEPLPDSDEWG